MATYTVTLSDVEEKGLGYRAYSIQDWINNAVKNQARKGMDNIYDAEVVRMNADANIDSIPADKDTIVANANVESAKVRSDKADAEAEALKNK